MGLLHFKDYGKLLYILIFLVFLYATYKIIAPFIGAILASIVLAIVTFPVYESLRKKIKNKNAAAMIIVILTLLLIVIPGIFFSNALLKEAINIYNAVGSLDLPYYGDKLRALTGLDIPFERYAEDTIQEFSNIFIQSSSNILRYLATRFVHIFTTFFLMFFLLRDGKEIANTIKKTLPISAYQRTRLYKGTVDLINGIFLGFLAIGLAEFLGSLLGFYLFGIPNPILWAFIIAIFAYLPFLGPTLIWIPASLYLFIQGNVVGALLLAVYFGLIISFYMDSILRAQLMQKTAKIHPIVSTVGIFGGIALFGIIGLIAGPLILSLFILLYKLYKEENDNT